MITLPCPACRDGELIVLAMSMQIEGLQAWNLFASSQDGELQLQGHAPG